MALHCVMGQHRADAVELKIEVTVKPVGLDKKLNATVLADVRLRLGVGRDDKPIFHTEPQVYRLIVITELYPSHRSV